MYSCAYFPDAAASLEEAQLAKLDRICERLRLGPENHLLEIGTGWGGMAIHAARRSGCRVTTTTISRAQHELAPQRVRDAGLEDRMTVLLEDYRDLEGRYDRLVSVEMIEAVGWQYFDDYFRTCDRLLADDGLMLLQAITIDDRIYEIEKAAKSFANTHVFPGGCLPSERRIANCLERVTEMRQVWLDDITAHYPPTLAAWRERFFAAWERLRDHGYDERFRRLWDFYLSSSEAGFRERRIGDVQVLFAKPGCAMSEAGGGREPLLLIHGLGGTRSDLGPGDPAAGGRAGGDRARHARLRHRAAAARRASSRPPPTSPRAAARAVPRAGSSARTSPATGSAAGSALEMGRFGWAASVTCLSPAGLWRARSANPPAAARGCCCAARAGSGSRAVLSLALRFPRTRRAAFHLRRPPRADPARRRRASWSSAGSTPRATTAPTGRCAATSSTPPATPPTCR